MRTIELDVVIFDAYTQAFRYAQGSISQNFVYEKLLVEIPRHRMNQMKTYMFGLVSFDISSNAPISLYTNMRDSFYLEIGSNDK